MANTVTSNLRKGNLVRIWNDSFRRYEWYRKTKRGRYILTNPFSKGSNLSSNTLHKKQLMDKPITEPRPKSNLQKGLDKVKSVFSK